MVFHRAWNNKYYPIMNDLSINMEKIINSEYINNPRNTGCYYTYLRSNK